MTAREMNSPSTARWSPPAGSEPWWGALVQDADANVAVIDTDGLVLFANDAFVRLCCADAVTGVVPPAADVVGANLRTLLPEGFADERIEFARTVARTGRPLTARSMWRGAATRVTIRPIARADAPGGEGASEVLMTIRDTTRLGGGAAGNGGAGGGADAAPADADVVEATVVDKGPLARLTPRELEVLALIGEGLSSRDIAKTLFRTVKTVEWHRSVLGKKLGVANRVELARIANRAGLHPGIVQQKKV